MFVLPCTHQFQECVQVLKEEPKSADEVDFWDTLWKIPTTAEDVFAMIQPDDVRELLRNQPDNLRVLVEQAIAQVVQIGETPIAEFYGQALTSIRVLTRVLPFLLEVQRNCDDPGSDFVEKTFWAHPTAPHANEDDFVGGGDERSSDTLPPSLECEGERLIHGIMDLLFLPNFTINASAYAKHTRYKHTGASVPPVDKALLWCGGVGFPDLQWDNSPTFDGNRMEVLRLMLACFSSSLFQTPESFDASACPWLRAATSKKCPKTSTLMYSLLNLAMTYDPVGFGLPYAGMMATDVRERLLDSGMQILLILLDFNSEVSAQAYLSTRNGNTDDPNVPKHVVATDNVYRTMIMSLSSRTDLEMVFTGLCRLLVNTYESASTLLPNSLKPIQCHQEVLVLLWKMLDNNRQFLAFAISRPGISQVCVHCNPYVINHPC
jgi:hypothetical protein